LCTRRTRVAHHGHRPQTAPCHSIRFTRQPHTTKHSTTYVLYSLLHSHTPLCAGIVAAAHTSACTAHFTDGRRKYTTHDGTAIDQYTCANGVDGTWMAGATDTVQGTIGTTGGTIVAHDRTCGRTGQGITGTCLTINIVCRQSNG
jgi:hypothetical protein